METTKWLPVKDYEGLYAVSNKGEVWSILRSKMLSPMMSAAGYATVGLYKNRIRKDWLISRLVAIAFIPNPENKPTVNHINEITDDNRVENLEWATRKEQVNHGTRTERAVKNTDYKARAAKTDYAKIAKKNEKPIYQCEKDYRIIKRFDSTTAAANELGLDRGNLARCLKGRCRTCGGYVWKYAVVI